MDATIPHTRIDNAIIDDMLPKIGAYGLAVYTVIKRHLNWTTGQCNPSYNRIAKIIGIDRSTVIRKVKILQKLGLIAANLQFKEDGSPTSNQFEFYQESSQKKKAAGNPGSTQKSSTAQMRSSTKPPPPVAQDNPPGRPAPPEQSSLNKSNETKKEETPVATEKQRECPHPYSEVVTLSEGITICNHCFHLIDFLPDAQAA